MTSILHRPIRQPILFPSVIHGGRFLDIVDRTTYTASAMTINTAVNRSLVVLSLCHLDGEANPIVSLTIGGVTATIHAEIRHATANDSITVIASAVVPTGTTADIVVTWTNACFRNHFNLWSLYNLRRTTPHDVQTDLGDLASVTISIPVGGICIATHGSQQTGASAGTDWTGITEDYDADGEGTNEGLSGGIATSRGDPAFNITASETGGTYVSVAMAAASWR